MTDGATTLTAACIVWSAGPPIGDDPTGDVTAIGREFPTVALDVRRDGPPIAIGTTFDEGRWRGEGGALASFDLAVDRLAVAGPFTLLLAASTSHAGRVMQEMLTRAQRHVGRRNHHSSAGAFDAVLARFRRAHDVSKPLVRADWNHALDAWQWLLRLDPSAGASVQMATLLHDVERLESETDRRVEHLAPDYAAFKGRHAARGAELALSLLLDAGVDRDTAHRAASLVASHEVPGDDPDRALLNDADALSFFSQNSDGYLDYFGPEHTRRKVAYSLGRMRPISRRRIDSVRLRPDVERIVHEVRTSVEASS